MQNTQLSEQITQLECIKKKIHKIKPQSEKLQNNIKLCPFPPGIRNTSQPLSTVRLSIPVSALSTKDTHLEELILWDFEDNFSDEQLFRNLFVIVFDFLEEKYQTKVKKLTALQATEIIDNCVNQVKQAIEDHKIYLNVQEVLQLETYIDRNDSLINIQIQTDKIKETIQWDLENTFSYIDEFATIFCYENKLDQEGVLVIGNQIREQIQKAFEKRFRMAAKLLDDQQEFKQKLLLFLDYPSFEPYQPIKEIPQSNDLNVFFKKNIEYLPPEMQQLYGAKPHVKQMLDLGVDQDDVKKFEKEFSQKSKYLDQTILQDIVSKSKQN